jgi:hypothetical protein
LPADFAGQVVRRYRRAERVRTLLYRGSLFAAAAAVVLALFLGKVLVGGPPRLPEVASTRGESPASPEIMQLVTAVRAGFDKLPDQLSQFSPPSLDLSVPSFTYQPPAPLDASLSSIRSLGDTFQGAVEPLERPAKEAYQKVIEIIDEPDLQKWIQKVKKGTS